MHSLNYIIGVYNNHQIEGDFFTFSGKHISVGNTFFSQQDLVMQCEYQGDMKNYK